MSTSLAIIVGILWLIAYGCTAYVGVKIGELLIASLAEIVYH